MTMTSTVERVSEPDILNGKLFLVDKPPGWSSFDVVAKMRSLLNVKRIGHAGSLDCNASGLLIVCTGKMTKQLAQFQNLDKEYIVTMRLGERTESYDSETPVLERRALDGLTDEAISCTLMKFVGWQTQLPPMWSAAKVGGKRLYKYARKGMEVERRPREVHIKLISDVTISLPDVHFTALCSKGTYIRSLVNDIGDVLGVGAYVKALRRVRIGEYTITDAATISDLYQRFSSN